MVPCSCESLAFVLWTICCLVCVCHVFGQGWNWHCKVDLRLFMPFSFVWHIQLKTTLNLCPNFWTTKHEFGPKTHWKARLSSQVLFKFFSSKVIIKTGKFPFFSFRVIRVPALYVVSYWLPHLPWALNFFYLPSCTKKLTNQKLSFPSFSKNPWGKSQSRYLLSSHSYYYT